MNNGSRLHEAVWKSACLTTTATIRDAIVNLNKLSLKIVLAVNERDELEGTVSDGDIRRGLLRGLTLDSPLGSVVHQHPMVVPEGMSREAVLQLMVVNKLYQIPIVDGKNHVTGIHLWDSLTENPVRSNLMVIMAGGKGTRLRPYTEKCPKPMVEVAGKPMLQHIIERAKSEGITKFILSLHYLGYMIEEHFGNGSRFGVDIGYLKEDEPLGTAGALSLLEHLPDEPFLVSNGDVMTDIKYGELLDFHIRHNASATMAVRRHEWQHPYGVVHINGTDIAGFEEKPIYHSYINAGVYAFDPRALHVLKTNLHCDMPAFFELIKAAGMETIAYPMHEPWLDVGKPDDLNAAQLTFAKPDPR